MAPFPNEWKVVSPTGPADDYDVLSEHFTRAEAKLAAIQYLIKDTQEQEFGVRHLP